MAIELACACGRLLRIEQPPAGGKTRCPACGALVTVAGTPNPVPNSDRTSAEPPARVVRKPLWALMGKSATPAIPDVTPPAQPATAKEMPDSTTVQPGRNTEGPVPPPPSALPPIASSPRAGSAPAAGPARKGLWGLMQSSPDAGAPPAVSVAPEYEIEIPEPENVVRPVPESVFLPAVPPAAEPADRALAAIIGIPQDATDVPAHRHAAAIRPGNSVKGMIAMALGLLSIPLSFLSLIDEFWSKFPATLVGFAGILLGMQALSEISHSAGRQTGRKLVIAGILIGVVGVFLGPLILAGVGRRMWQASTRSVAEGHLQTIGQGLNRYHDREGAFPPGGVFKAGGDRRQRGYHGWMTLLLPFVGEEAMYQRIDLDVPFDDKANLSVFGEDVELFFAAGSDRSLVLGRFSPSHFAGVGGEVENDLGDVSRAGLFGINSKVTRDDVKDGLSNTLAAGEIADNFPPWGDPENWRTIGKGINRDSQGFGNHDRTGACFLMADGSVRFFSNKTSTRVMTALSTRDGGEKDEK